MLWKIFSIIVSILTLMALWNALDGVALEQGVRLAIGVIASIGLFLYAFKIESSNKNIWRYFLFFYFSHFLSGLPSTLSNQFQIVKDTKSDIAFAAAIVAIVISLGLSFLNLLALWRYSEFQQWVESKVKIPR